MAIQRVNAQGSLRNRAKKSSDKAKSERQASKQFLKEIADVQLNPLPSSSSSAADVSSNQPSTSTQDSKNTPSSFSKEKSANDLISVQEPIPSQEFTSVQSATTKQEAPQPQDEQTSKSKQDKKWTQHVSKQPLNRYILRPAISNSLLVSWPTLDSWVQMHLLNLVVQNIQYVKRFKKTRQPLKNFEIGINSVTRLLEDNIAVLRKSYMKNDPSPSHWNIRKPLLIFACYGDMNPPTLLEHIPILVAAYNSLLQKLQPNMPPAILVPLSNGAESAIANAFSLRKASLTAFFKHSLSEQSMFDLYTLCAKRIHILYAPWTVPRIPTNDVSSSPVSLVPTEIKQMITSMPLKPKEKADAKKRYLKHVRILRKKHKLKKSIAFETFARRVHRKLIHKQARSLRKKAAATTHSLAKQEK